jgi:hypothetical protein
MILCSFWKMSWPIAMLFSITVICICIIVALLIILRDKRKMMCHKYVNEEFMRWGELKRKQEWHNNVSKDSIFNKERENYEKRIEKLNKDKVNLEKQKKELEEELNEKVQFDLNNLALMLYALSNKKDALSDMTKLSDEVEDFKKAYNNFENYLKNNQ